MWLLFKRIANRLGRPYGINPFPRAFENNLTAEHTSLGSVFNTIFSQNYWGSDDSRSGIGSEQRFAEQYADQLVDFIQSHQIRSMLDAPCGDLAWMQHVLARVSLNYIGGDVSTALIDTIRPKFPSLDLRVLDLTQDKLPTAQLLHCRDCLFHLSFQDLSALFENVIHSDFQYVLLTTHRSRLMHRNLDVGSGGFRFLDLQKAPFNLPEAELYLTDYVKGVEFPRHVGLWPVGALASAMEGLKTYRPKGQKPLSTAA